MYTYLRKNELKEAILKNREALVVTNVITKDIAEYVVNQSIILGQFGLGQNILSQPKISCISRKNNEYIIVYFIRSNVKIDARLLTILDTILRSFNNIKLLRNFMLNNTNL